MSLSASSESALCRIAEIAGSESLVSDLVVQAIRIMCDEMQAEATSVVVAGDEKCGLLEWHEFGETRAVLPNSGTETKHASKVADRYDYLAAQARMALHSDLADCASCITYELSQIKGRRAVVVVQLAANFFPEDSFLKLASGHLSSLLALHESNLSLTESRQLESKRIQEIAALYDIGRATGSTYINALLNMVCAKAALVMDAQTCSLMLADERDGFLVIEASYGLADEIVKGTKISFGTGIAGQVAASGEPMLITDVASDPRFSGEVRARSGVSGSMCVPMKDQDGAVYGVLSIRRHSPKPPFTSDDLKLFSVFSTHAGLALSNAELYSRLNEKIQEMAAISDVLRTINSSMDLERLLVQITSAIKDVVGFDRCCVYLLDRQTGEFVARARMGYRPEDKVVERVNLDEGVIAIAATERVPVFSRASLIGSDDNFVSGEFLVAPIVVNSNCIGAVVVDNPVTSKAIRPEQVELLSTFVSQAGIAVENARLYEAMEAKYEELNLIYENVRKINASYGLQNACDTLIDSCSKAIRCSGAGLVLLDSTRGHAELLSARGDIERVAEVLQAAANDENSLQWIRSQKQPEVVTSEIPASHLMMSVFDAKWHSDHSVLFAPLITEDRVIGSVVMSRNVADEFREIDIKLASIIAGHASTVISSAIIMEAKMSQSVFELTTLYEFSKKISSSANLLEALDSILSIVGNLVDYDESFIYVVDEDHSTASVKASRFRSSMPSSVPPDEPLDSGNVIGWAIRERKAIVSPDFSRDRRFSGIRKAKRKLRSLMVIPLVVHDEVVGALAVHSDTPRRYAEDNVRVLSIIASQGAAIYSALEALSRLTSYTDNILASIAAGVVTLDPHSTVISWNKAAERITGIDSALIIGKRGNLALELLPITRSGMDLIENAIALVMDTGETYNGYKLAFRRTDANKITRLERDELTGDFVAWLNMSISKLRNTSGDVLGLVIIFEDTTHEIEMDNKMRRMSELAAIGQLAANIAHELRNPLSSIKGAAQFIQHEYAGNEPISEFLSIIVEEVNGLSKLTTEFLEFARPIQLDLRPVSINEIIKKNLQLMQVTIADYGVEISTNLDHNIPDVYADGKQLEQVLRNMILNALQAMTHGGKLILVTEERVGGVCLSVADTGVGIPQEKLGKIFQPFFTTKTKGTGLGLSIVGKIVENHSGRIEVDSTPGKGTTFRILLPLKGTPPVFDVTLDTDLERRMPEGIKGLELFEPRNG